jgi:hypothetical protein
MGRWDDIFILLSSKDIDGGEVALGMSVLSSLGSRYGTDLKLITIITINYIVLNFPI